MTVNWGDYGGVLFDLDGVITPTAEVHMHAWSRMFNTYLMERSMSDEQAPAPYTDQDYYDYVDGKPRYDGVRSFLESRGLDASDEIVTSWATSRTTCSARCCTTRASRRTPAPCGCSMPCASGACRWRSCRRRATPPPCSRPRA